MWAMFTSEVLSYFIWYSSTMTEKRAMSEEEVPGKCGNKNPVTLSTDEPIYQPKQKQLVTTNLNVYFRSQWVRNWTVWKYFVAYFPATLIKTAELPANQNYLLAIFPHGVLR